MSFISNLFKAPKMPKMPKAAQVNPNQPIAPAPRRSYEGGAMGAAQSEVTRLLSAKGFGSTIATSPLGLVGGNVATSRSVLGYG